MPQITSDQISKPILNVVLEAVAQGLGLNGTSAEIAEKAQGMYLTLIDQPGILVTEQHPCKVPEYRVLMVSGLATLVAVDDALFLVSKPVPPSLIC